MDEDVEKLGSVFRKAIKNWISSYVNNSQSIIDRDIIFGEKVNEPMLRNNMPCLTSSLTRKDGS